MPQFPRSSAHLEIAPDEQRSSESVDKNNSFRILIVGDFSGRANRGVNSALAGRRPVMVDRDNADDVLASMHAGLSLPGVNLQFTEIDDFHPDYIYRNAEVFQRLAEQRNQPLATQSSSAAKVEISGRSLLDEMMAEKGEQHPAAPEHTGDLADFLKKIVAPHLVEREDPRMLERAAILDSTAASAMLSILHHPDFQALEAAWRAVWMLVHGLDTDGDLKLYIFDARLEELAGDPSGSETLFGHREEPWSVIVANYAFGQTGQDAKLLSRFGQMARAGGAPFLAESIAPTGSDAATPWGALRRSPEAHWIGLALPRFLLRLPYGRETSPVDSFEFDEMPKSKHPDYLWGNPAFCCAYLLGKAFLKDGWDMRPGSVRQMDGLPLHVYKEDGASTMKPCAEILMTENEADFLMEAGIMPLASMKGQDAVLLVRFQSIADPPAALSGPWEA